MASRTKKLNRIREVLHALETIERARVGQLTVEIDKVQAAENEILESLAEPTGLHGRFVGLLSRRVGSLERQLHGLNRDRETALDKYCDAMMRERAAASLCAKSQVVESRAEEEKELEGLLQFFEAANAQGRGKSRGSP